MIVDPGVKQVIKFKTQESWGFAPLPETTFKLITSGAKDKVQIVHRVGQSKKIRTVKVSNGTYRHWIQKLTAIDDVQSYLDSMQVTDGNLQDLWFVSNGKKIHFHWLGPIPEKMQSIKDLTGWLQQLKLDNCKET